MVVDIALGIVLAVIILAMLPLAIFVGLYALAIAAGIAAVVGGIWLVGTGFDAVVTRWPESRPWIVGAFAAAVVIAVLAGIVATIRDSYRRNPTRVKREATALLCLSGSLIIGFALLAAFPTAAGILLITTLVSVIVMAIWLQKRRNTEDARSGAELH